MAAHLEALTLVSGSPTRRPAPPRPVRILLLEDRPAFRTAVCSALAAHGVQVVAACACPRAAEAILISRGADALVLANGLSAGCRALVDRAADLPSSPRVVLITDVDASAWRLFDDGRVHALVGTTLGIEQVAHAVRRIHAGARLATGIVRPATSGHDPQVPLTRREGQVLDLLALGSSNEDIAATLEITVNTVRTYVQGLLRKLGEGRRVQAVRRAEELGLLGRRPA